MTSSDAMANVVHRAQQLSIARNYAAKYPDKSNDEYVLKLERLYHRAYLDYTDPFRSKTYA